MGIFSYIIPHEWVLQLVIVSMIALAAFVIYKCMHLYMIGKENLAMLEKMEDVSLLENAMLQNDVNLDHVFANYEVGLGKTDATFVLFEHLKAIYDSGRKSSRLDADLLVKNTVNKIFTSVDSIKTSISLFLVIGILGTLAGLAISIGGFHGANFVMSGTGGTTADELSLLFGNLRGAFAPSMWGIFFTIVFVFGYYWKIQEGCINKVTEKLTINTIRYWLPTLYPTDFQRGDQSLVKLNAAIANADGINQGVRDLESNLNSSNQTLVQLAKVSDSIQTATEKFDKSTDKIAEVKALYEELKRNNESFGKSLQELINSASENQKTSYEEYQKIIDQKYANLISENQKLKDSMVQYFDALSDALDKQNNAFASGLQSQIESWQATMDSQNERLTEVVTQLKSYDAGFFQSINESQEALLKSIDINRRSAEANQLLAEKLREFEEKLLDRQNELMVQIAAPMNEQLAKIASSIGRIQDPLDDTAKKISAMADKFVDHMERTLMPINQLVQAMQTQQNSLIESEDNLKALVVSIRSMMETFGREHSAMMASLAKQSGASPELIKKYIEAQTKNQEAEATRGKRRRAESQQDEKLSWQAGLLNLKNIPALVIALLLLVSVITQVVMVNKLSTLEQNQNAVNQVLLKGELNPSKANANGEDGANGDAGVTANAAAPDAAPAPAANPAPAPNAGQ